jgi:hypothetical protein
MIARSYGFFRHLRAKFKDLNNLDQIWGEECKDVKI